MINQSLFRFVHVGLMAVGVLVSMASPPVAYGAEGKGEVSVQVQSTTLRASPQHWAKSVSELRYGDRLAVVDSLTKDTAAGVPGWLKVKKGGSQGFVHASAVTTRTVVIQGRSGGTGTNVSSGDVVLAGKGFNADVERSYVKRGLGANYAEVDRMEARKVSNSEVASFISAGRLGPQGGRI